MTIVREPTTRIEVNHIARVEGHGNIRIEIENGRLVDCAWEVVETPRFFEVMFRGLSVEMAPMLAARVCGICSISHALTAARACEQAMGIEVPEQAQKVRLLAKHAETLQSHTLHLFFLAAPDFLGVGSVIPLAESHPEVFELAARLRGFANRTSDLLVGRTSHPMVIRVGGLTQMPRENQLNRLLTAIDETVPSLWRMVDFFNGIPMPAFVRETEFVSLKGDGSYPFIGGDLVSSDGVCMPESAYREMTNEYLVSYSTSKVCRLSRESFAVGALARFNNNFAHLHPKAKEAAQMLALSPMTHNPFAHNLAQVVECVHVVYEMRDLVRELMDTPQPEYLADYRYRAGEGVAAVEAPRGILYHHFEVDAGGRIARADCVIPTGQNHANIRFDLEKLVAEMAVQGVGVVEISKRAQMLVRAYDPCISCSVH